MGKRVFLACLAWLAFATSGFAESSVGVLAGVNLATLHEPISEQGSDLTTKAFFAGGGVAQVGLGGHFSLLLEPMFIQRGSKIALTLFGETSTGSLRLSYVELPVLVSLSLGKGNVRPYVLAGPTLGYLTSATALIDSNGKKTDTLDQFNRTGVGVSFGGGVRIPAGSVRVFVEGCYNLGLNNIIKDTSGSPEGSALKNRGVLIVGGVTFPIGRQ